MVAAASSAGCILLPDLGIGEEENPPSSPPVVIEIAPQEFLTPGPPLQIEQNETRQMTLSVSDNDIDDIIHVRFFVNYGRPDRLGPKADCSASSSGEVMRQVQCNLATICEGVDVNSQHFLEAVVADDEFLETSDPAAADQPPFRALPEDAKFTITAWTLECVESNGS